MSRADFKPVACKGNCGKDIIFERQQDGKWLVSEFDVENWVKLEKHNCPNYKPQPKPFEKRGGGTNWAGTNKQGQFVEARESAAEQIQETKSDLIMKKLDDMLKLMAQILFILKKPEIELTDEEIKKIAETEKIDEPSLRIADKEDEYGF